MAVADEDRAFLQFLADKQVEVEQAASSRGGSASVSPADLSEASEIANYARQAGLRATGATSLPGKYSQFKTLVFITLGMPEKTLRALFRQAAGSPQVGFVLRGMASPDIYREIKKIRDLMSKEGEAIVFVDPILFKNYHVDRAPFTLHKAGDGRWYGLWGEIAIEGAKELIEKGQGGRTRPPVGPLYSIKEPDMLEQMRKKFDSADWTKVVEGAKKRALQSEINYPLPPAPSDRVRLVDVSTRLQRDVVGPKGEILAKAGTIINPLEHVSLDSRYVVFDPTSRHETAIVAKWKREYPSVTLIATHWDTKLGAKFDSPVYVLDPLLKRRFQVEHTPSLIEQDGFKIRVTEVRARP